MAIPAIDRMQSPEIFLHRRLRILLSFLLAAVGITNEMDWRTQLGLDHDKAFRDYNIS